MKTREQTAFPFGAPVRVHVFEREPEPVYDWQQRDRDYAAARTKELLEKALGTDAKGQKKLAQQQRRDAKQAAGVVLTATPGRRP